LIRSALAAALGAGCEGTLGIAGHRHGSRLRLLTGSFGPIKIAVPRARIDAPGGGTTEWKSRRCGPTIAARWPPTR
jgi:hypothetical protein